MPKPCAYCQRADYLCANCTAPAPISTRGVMRSPTVSLFLASFTGTLVALAAWTAATSLVGCYGVEMPSGPSAGAGGYGGHPGHGGAASSKASALAMATSAASSVASSSQASTASSVASTASAGGAPVSLPDAGQGGSGGAPQCAVDLDCGVTSTCVVWACIAGACLATEAPRGSPCLETCIHMPCLANVPQPSLRVGYCEDGACVAGIPLACMTDGGTVDGCAVGGPKVTFDGSLGCAYVDGVGYSVGYCAPGVACGVELDGGAAVGSCL